MSAGIWLQSFSRSVARPNELVLLQKQTQLVKHILCYSRNAMSIDSPHTPISAHRSTSDNGSHVDRREVKLVETSRTRIRKAAKEGAFRTAKQGNSFISMVLTIMCYCNSDHHIEYFTI